MFILLKSWKIKVLNIKLSEFSIKRNNKMCFKYLLRVLIKNDLNLYKYYKLLKTTNNFYNN